jgi:hypothetical protein
MFTKGETLGWTNVANPQLRGNITGFGMDDDGSSWVGSTVAIGGILGSAFAGEVKFTFLRSLVLPLKNKNGSGLQKCSKANKST